VTDSPNINDYPAHNIIEKLKIRKGAREEIAKFPGKPPDGEERKEWNTHWGIVRTQGDNVRLWIKEPLDPQHQPFPHLFALLAKDPLQPTTRAVKRNLNLVWGTLAFGLFAYGFKWPPKIVVLGLEVQPGAHLMWALFGLLAYHLTADAGDWLKARREVTNLLDLSKGAIDAVKGEGDLADEAWLKASAKKLRGARWLFRTAYFRFALDFTVPILFAIATGVALAMIGPPPKVPLCPCPTGNQP